MSKKKPRKWTDVYPVGTKTGDQEARFFRSLARNPRYDWRSTAAISKESGLSKVRVEEIINKYLKKGMVFQSPKNVDHWGYWERVPQMLPDDSGSIAQVDQKDRIDKALNSAAGTLPGSIKKFKGKLQEASSSKCGCNSRVYPRAAFDALQGTKPYLPRTVIEQGNGHLNKNTCTS